jgi:hypothetical protein
LSVAALATASLLLLRPASAHAQGGVPLWTNYYAGGSVFGITVDGSGNVLVVTGSATIKYSNEGVPLWTNISNGDHIATDSSGNVFVAGSGSTIKYSDAGVPLWTNVFGEYVAVDNSGKVCVTAPSDDGSGTYRRFMTIKYSNDGAPLWTNSYTGSGQSAPRAIAADSSGSVFVSGYSLKRLDSFSSSDYLTIAYSNAGAPLWTNWYNGSSNKDDYVSSLGVDSRGNVFLTGNSVGVRGDYATVAYSNSGVPLWTNRYNGPVDQGDYARAITVDSNGNVFVTGDSVTVRDFFSDPPDWATIKYSNSGVPLWTNYYNGPGNNSDSANAIAVDRAGNVFVTGWSVNTPFPDVTIDYATVAYSSEGVPLWESHYISSSAGLNTTSVAVDHAGNVFVTGYPTSSDPPDYLTIKYSSSIPPPVQLDFQLLNNQLVLSWTNAGFNLQTAPAVTGPFANLPAATSPYTNSITGPQQFFQLTSN